MDIRPIISALMRNRTGALLVALQIAITLAVLANAGFIVQQRLAKMDRPSGYDEQNIVTVQAIAVDAGSLDASNIAADLRALHAMPGVIAASVTPQLPLTNSGLGWGLSRTGEPNDPDTVNVSLMLVDENADRAFGMKLAEGRWFRSEELVFGGDIESLLQTTIPGIVLTRDVADRLFPEGGALGQTVYDFPGHASRIIGIVDKAQGYFVNSPGLDSTVFWPVVLSGMDAQRYVIRTTPTDVGNVARGVEQALLGANPRRIVRQVQTLADIRAASYQNDRAMTVTLLTVMGLLVVVTVLGIFGLTSFNVSRRRKQIGTRRALGARRSDILRHFLVESWLIATAGALVGIALAVGLSVWLVSTFELPRLDWRYLPAGIIVLWVVAQAAAFGPARRAAAVEPAIATRSA